MAGETVIIVYHISKEFGQSELPQPVVDTDNIEYLIREHGYISAGYNDEVYLHPHDIVNITIITGED